MDALRRISPGVVALIGFPVASYFLIRPRNSQWLRFALSTAGSATMIHLGCKDIMPGYFAGVLRASICWMTSIRLVDVMTRPDPERKNMTFTEFAGKFAWFFLPISKNPSPRAPREQALHIAYHIGLGAAKLVTADFVSRWLLRAVLLAGGGEVIRQHYWTSVQLTAMFGMLVFTTSVMNDIQIAAVSLISRDRYQVLDFNNWPVLSKTLREFWSRRYNLLVSTLLKESVFQPLQREGFSKDMAALGAFAVSGLLHTHIAHVCFGGGAISSFVFFALHGAMCWAESKLMRGRQPDLVSAVATQTALLLTAPLYLGLYVYQCPAWLLNNPGDFRSPIHIPVPAWLYCPKP